MKPQWSCSMTLRSTLGLQPSGLWAPAGAATEKKCIWLHQGPGETSGSHSDPHWLKCCWGTSRPESGAAPSDQIRRRAAGADNQSESRIGQDKDGTAGSEWLLLDSILQQQQKVFPSGPASQRSHRWLFREPVQARWGPIHLITT